MKKTSAGFTLVELIVVIAILGILAGIAIPVYSGYIKKAHEAADNQLLAAVNTAFGAACLENGVDMALQPDYYAGVTVSDGRVTGVTKWNDAFLRYYAGNEDAAFEVYTALWFKNGVFAPATGETTVTLENVGTITVDNAALADYLASTLNEMGVQDLTGGIDTLVERVLNSTSVNGFLSSSEYAEFLSGLELNAASMSAKEKANALALLAASQASDIDKDAMLTAMANGKNIPISGSGENGVGTAAALYAMMMMYANTPEATITTTAAGRTERIMGSALNGQSIDDYISNNYPAGTTYQSRVMGEGDNAQVVYAISVPATTSSQSALTYFNNATSTMTGLQSVTDMYTAFAASDGFRQYVATQGETDFDGYLAAMDIVNANMSNSKLVSNVLDSGWSEGGIEDILSAVLGG